MSLVWKHKALAPGFLLWYSWWSAAPRWHWSTCESWGVRAAAAGEAAGPQQAAPQVQLCSPAGSAASTWALEAGVPGWRHRRPTACPYKTEMSQRTNAYRKSALSILPKTENVLLRNVVFSDKTPETKTNKNWVSLELKKQMQWRISCFPLFYRFQEA